MDKIWTSKDYWPTILKLADEDGNIKNPDEKKGLDEYLRQQLGLSKPTINALLKDWEEQGKIILKRQGFLKKVVGLQIIPQRRILVLVDWENIFHNITDIQKVSYASISQAFTKLTRKLEQEIGRIVFMFVFTPPHLASILGETLQEFESYIVYCSKRKGEADEEEDTVDEVLMKLGEKLIQEMELSHLCICSGDEDFEPLYTKAKLNKIKIITVYASEKSLSAGVIKLSDKIILFPIDENERD